MTSIVGLDEPDVHQVPYRPAAPGVPIEAITLSSLIDRVGSNALGDLEQLHFDLLVVCTEGAGQHEVDFVRADLGPRRLLHVRPGQVHRWILDPPYEAVLIMLEPIAERSQWSPGPDIVRLTDDRADDLRSLLDLLTRRRRSGPLPFAALAALRQVVISTLDLDADVAPLGEPLHVELLRALATDGYRNRSVGHYAALLGCSTRTLARACERATGTGPKQLIDEATALAAQRALRLPGATVTSVAAALEFDEVSNFTKFFKRLTGVTPSDWQRAADPD